MYTSQGDYYARQEFRFQSEVENYAAFGVWLTNQ